MLGDSPYVVQLIHIPSGEVTPDGDGFPNAPATCLPRRTGAAGQLQSKVTQDTKEFFGPKYGSTEMHLRLRHPHIIQSDADL
jgi:hypothetical protein